MKKTKITESITNNIDDTIKLAQWSNGASILTITIKDYLNFVNAKDKAKIADFIYNRLQSRYLKPFLYDGCHYIHHYKNGFSIMANCCLLIEALQSFKNGWGDSKKKSSRIFKQFLSTEKNFSPLKNMENEFYINIRCGILHQGESTGGWKISRKGLNIFDKTNLVVNSTCFAQELNNSLLNYKKELETSDWDSMIWNNFRTKMANIIENCRNQNDLK